MSEGQMSVSSPGDDKVWARSVSTRGFVESVCV